jgi:hypothetical protein
MKRALLVGVLALGLVTACSGGSPTTPSAPAPTASVAALSISPLTVSVDTNGGSVNYHITWSVRETSGKSGATISAITYTFDNGDVAQTSLTSTTKLAAGQKVDVGPINYTGVSGKSPAANLTLSIAFTDDGGHSGNTSTSTSIASLRFFSLVGFVRDQNGANVNGTVTIASGPDQGKTANGGYYTFGALQAGTFTVTATAGGYFSSTQTVTLNANSEVDFALQATPPPAPAVEYRITGTARRCSATYENSSGGTNQQEVNVPFSYTWPSAHANDFMYMSCQIDTGGDGGSITIQLLRNGITIQSAMANGFPNIATVSGLY